MYIYNIYIVRRELWDGVLRTGYVQQPGNGNDESGQPDQPYERDGNESDALNAGNGEQYGEQHAEQPVFDGNGDAHAAPLREAFLQLSPRYSRDE